MPTIRVVVRFRPINSREKQTALDNKWSGKQICPLYVDEKHLLSFDGDDVSEDDKIGKQVRCAPPKVQIAHQPKFAFDEILIWVNQNTAFMRIGLPVVNDALSGVNGTIFAYGQTGSGKTFSMFGPEPLTAENAKLLGIIPRCCAEVFSALDRDTTIKAYRIDVSFFEIYIHNQIRDLLHPAKKGDPPLKIRDGLKGVFIEHLKSETATNLQEILSLIALANSHRTVSSTKMNATSSRSHSVMNVMIRIERKDGSRVKSIISFVDLAGSEKVRKTGATGQNLREAQAINQSLTMLGNVISALAKIGSGKKKAGAVPYRDSALTQVLKDSLSGNCKTTLLTAASPHKFNLMETISSFRFASRCKLVKTKAQKNVMLSAAQMMKMIESLKKEIKSLKMQLLQGGGGVGSALGGIGVNITWPSDYGAWTTDKKTYGVLRKQVNAQIKEVLQTSVATNSDDVASMPYAISLSPAGSKRKVTIQFHCDDEDEDGDYDRQTCIELSKKLAKQIDKINKKSLSPALKAYKECRAFSEAGVSELKELIEKQKLQITLLGEEVSAAQQEVKDLQQSVGHLDNAGGTKSAKHSDDETDFIDSMFDDIMNDLNVIAPSSIEPNKMASLQQFSCDDIIYKIEEWIVNDRKYNQNLLKTKQILSNRSLNGEQMSFLSPENIKQIIKDEMLQFMSHDTLRIIFECFAEWKADLKNDLKLKQQTTDEIGELLFHFPINKLLNTMRQEGMDGKCFIQNLEENSIEDATGWPLDEVSQIESVLLHHYTLSKSEFVEYVRHVLTNEQDAYYRTQPKQTLPNDVIRKIEDIVLSFDVEELQFKIQSGLGIDAFSDAIINMVHDTVSDENDNEMVKTIYDAVSDCFVFNYDGNYHPRWICYNCSNRNLITYIDNHMDTDLSICSLCGIQRKESVLLRIRNHPTFMDVLDEHKHNNNDHPHDMDDLESTIVTTANNESISLTCPNRNDNKNCTSMINLCKRLIQYNRWINTVSDKLNGKDNIENTIDVDIQKYLDDDVFQTVFMNSIRSLQRLNTHDANLLIQMSHDICMTAFFEMSRIQFARYVSEQTNTKIGLGLRLYSKIMKSAKQKAHTRAFGVFLSDIHMDVVDRDYHHILNVHIHKGTKDTIKNAFRFFNTLVHYSDTDDVIKQCRSVHRRGNRVRQLHSLEKREDEDISLDTNIWKLKQFYNQTQLDMIHTFLVHNTWQSVMQRFIPSQHVDDDNDEYHLDESKHKEIDLQNKGKYITGAGDLSKTKQNHYGFGVDHSHPHLSPIHDSIRDELAFNKMFPLTESQFQNLLIKAIKLHQIAIETEYRRDLICKYYNKHYNIIRNEPIGLRHVFAIIAYTDLSKFCTAYRSTYRLIDDEKTAFEVTQRHRQLYYYSRALFEAIEFFGSLMESGLSVYHGLNKVMFFESFRTFFNQPISTTLNMSTAIQFSGGIGTILTLKSGAINMNDPSKVPKYLPVSWLSCFPNEDEKLFYGAYVNFKIKNIIEAQKMKGHKKELKLLHKFEDTIKNKCVIWNAKNKKDKQRLQTLILLIKEQTCDPSVITPYGKKLFEYFCANSNSVCIQSFELLPIELRNALFGEQISLDPILRLFPNLKDITLNKLNIDQMTRDAKTYADVVLKHINKAQLQKLERIVFKSIKQGGGKQNSRLKKLADKYAQQYSKCNWKIQYKLTKLDIENTHDLSFINHNTSKQTEKKERMETAAKRNSIVVINKSQIYDHIPFHFMQVRSVNIDEFMVEISVDTLSNQKRKLFIKEIGTDDSDVVVPVRIPKRKTSCLRSIYVDCDEKHGEEYNLGLFENKQAQDPIENCTPIQVVMPKDIKQLPPYNEAYKPNPIDSAQVFASSDETSKQMNIYWATPSETYGDISYKVTYKTIQGDSSVEIVSSLPYSIVVSLLPVSFEVVTLCTVHETVYKSDPSEMINVSGFTKTK
eukprot:842644_1